MITYIRNDPSVALQYSFRVEKQKDKKSEIIAEFQLLKAAKGNIRLIISIASMY